MFLSISLKRLSLFSDDLYNLPVVADSPRSFSSGRHPSLQLCQSGKQTILNNQEVLVVLLGVKG